MRSVLAIARRELDAYFATPVGWLCLCGFVAIMGFFFALMVSGYAYQSTQMAMNPYAEGFNINEYLLPDLFGNNSVIMLFLCPLLSMHLFAKDRDKRSFELLMSAPITSAEIVLGKYLGALGFLAAMMASTLHLVAILYWLGTPDAGVLLSSYLALFVIGALFLAVGMFVSSLTNEQLVAAVLSFGILLGLWVLSWADAFADQSWVKAITYVSMLSHQSDLSKGLLHLKDLVYFGTFIGFFLFATQQRVEAFRWQ